MKKLIWLIIPVMIIVGYATREQLRQAVGIPNTGTDTSTSAAAAVASEIPATAGPAISVLPAQVLQGDPAVIVVSASSSVTKLTYNGKTLSTFDMGGKPSAIVGIDLKQAPGSYPIVATLVDGTTLKGSLVVGKRTIPEAPLGIPDSLGGNTPQAATNLVNQLAKDNAVLNSVPTVMQKLWDGKFGYPVSDPVVTDTYGYTRDTVNTTISHKGTDFHAPPGTRVLAMNSGTVRIAQFFTAYGNTVVIDHGFGIQTMYMHLSELDVKVGDTVKKGQTIGLSGETGYAEGPHLHISVKIGGISIDPEKFLKLF